MKTSFLPLSWWVLVLVFCMLLAAYAFTLAPAVLHIDSGELAAAQYSLGVTHPTGYPLFTILGYLFFKIPLFERPIVQANFLAAIFTAAGVALFSRLLFLFLTYSFPGSKFKKEKIVPIPCSEKDAFWISSSAGLLFGFNLTVWAQATSVEVYSLQLLLFSILFTCLFDAWEKNSLKSWVLVSVSLALGFSNHMTTLMALPTCAIIYFYKKGLNQKSLKDLLFPALAGFGILIFSYGFLFWRGASNTMLNWGNIHDWTSLWRHMTGHQYNTWIFAGSKVAAKNLGEFLKSLPKEWVFLGPILMVYGLGSAFRTSRIWALSFLIGLIFNIMYVIQYDIKDLEPYFLLALMAMAFFITFGLKRMLEKLQKTYFAPLLLLIPAGAFVVNLSASDQSKTYFFETYTLKSLESVEPNALVLSQQWDFLITPYYYFKIVEKKFPGLLVLDKELMKRSWYIKKQMELFDPEILNGAESEKEEFLKQLKPFEDSKSYNANLIEESYQALIGKVLVEQSKKRPVYIEMDFIQNQELRLPSGYSTIPMGFWLKLVPDGHPYLPAELVDFKPEYPENWNNKSPNEYYSSTITRIWNNGCMARSEYEIKNGKMDEARKWQLAIINP